MARSQKRKIGIIAGILVAGATLVWELQPSPRAVETAVVKRGPLSARVAADGRTRVRDLYVVTAPVDGDVERITLKEGDRVSIGTTLARIHPVAPRPLDERSRAEAVAAVSAARSAVTQAEANQKEAAAALNHVESELNTTRKLVNEGVSPANNLEHAEHQVQIRREAVEAARAGAAASRAELERAEAVVAATSNKSGQPAILVHSPVHLRAVQPGKSDAANTVVERGLAEGEQVVTQPSDLLRDGMRVKSATGPTRPTTGGHS